MDVWECRESGVNAGGSGVNAESGSAEGVNAKPA